jgi:hypothetical protein
VPVSDAQHRRRSFRRRSRKALHRFLRFTVAPKIRIGTAACASVGARYRFTRPGRGRGRSVVPVTGGRTWTQVRARAGPPIAQVAPAPSSLQKIRLSSDVPNPLRKSRNWRADGDGSSICTLIRVSRGGGFKDVTGSQSAPACQKAVAPLSSFHRGIDSLQHPVPVDPTASPGEDR